MRQVERFGRFDDSFEVAYSKLEGLSMTPPLNPQVQAKGIITI